MEEEEEGGDHEVWAWSWGAGTDGQLGTGNLEDRHLPLPLGLPPVSLIACGGAHTIALTGNRRVLTWGRGTRGQLGHGELENCLQPKPVKFFESLTVSNVSAGWSHSGFVTDEGRLFMCGDGSFGQLGNGDNQSHSTPVEVLFFASKHVEQVACGTRHSLALLTGPSGNSIYGFGSGRHGQIGSCLSGNRRLQSLPELIQGFENCTIISVHANGDHSAALSANGQLYIWGRGFAGRSDIHLPHILPLCSRISQVALGWNHALVMADDVLYMFGGNRHGMLSGPQQVNPVRQVSVPSTPCISSDEPSLERVPNLDGVKVVCVAAGAEHSALLTGGGEIMTWGWGEHGQLGLGNTCDQTCPQIVDIDYKGSIAPSQLRIYCGSGFTIVAATA